MGFEHAVTDILKDQGKAIKVLQSGVHSSKRASLTLMRGLGYNHEDAMGSSPSERFKNAFDIQSEADEMHPGVSKSEVDDTEPSVPDFIAFRSRTRMLQEELDTLRVEFSQPLQIGRKVRRSSARMETL